MQQSVDRRLALIKPVLLERALYALINEGAKIREEGIVDHPAALDAIFVTGYGFPAQRSEPMWFDRRVGLKALCRRLHEFEERYGSRRAPAALRERLAAQGRSFSDFG